MAAGGAAAEVAGPSWVGDALNGTGDWAVRTRAPYLLGLLMLFDSWDSIAIAYTLPSLVAEWKMSALSAGWLISAGYGGQFLGALLFGLVAERFGRLPVLRPLVVVMSLLALGCAVARSYDQLLVMRLAQGLAIGGALPIAISYVNEVAPTATRGRFFGSFQVLFTGGFGIASFTSAWVIPAFGWRTMFALGAIPLLILPFTRVLPESPRWLAGKGRVEEAASALLRLGSGALPDPAARAVRAVPVAERVPAALLFAPEIRRRSIVVMLLWFLTSLVSFGMVTWIPSLYVTMFKVPVADALRYNLFATVAIFLLPFFLRALIDRLGRRPLPIAGTAIGGVALLAMMFIDVRHVALVVALALLGQVGVSIGSMVLWPYSAETYPTRTRSLALGTCSSIARAASMLTPLLVGGVLQLTGSVTLVFLVFGLSSLVVAALWWFGTVETAGREISD